MNTESVLPEVTWIHPQMWKTVVDWKKKKSSMEQMTRRARMTDSPTKTVAALKAGLDTVERSSRLPWQSSEPPEELRK